MYCSIVLTCVVYRILGSSLWNWRNQWGMSHGAVLIHTLHLSWKRRKWPSFPYISMDQDHLKLQSRQAKFFTCKLSRLSLLILCSFRLEFPLLNTRSSHWSLDCITLLMMLMFLKAALGICLSFHPHPRKNKKKVQSPFY